MFLIIFRPVCLLLRPNGPISEPKKSISELTLASYSKSWVTRLRWCVYLRQLVWNWGGSLWTTYDDIWVHDLAVSRCLDNHLTVCLSAIPYEATARCGNQEMCWGAALKIHPVGFFACAKLQHLPYCKHTVLRLNMFSPWTELSRRVVQ